MQNKITHSKYASSKAVAQAQPVPTLWPGFLHALQEAKTKQWLKILFVVALLLVSLMLGGDNVFAQAPESVMGPTQLTQPGGEALPLQAPEQAVANRPVLVLDAGHGGIDPGAIDPVNGVLEADVNQWILNRLEPMLRAHENELELVITHQAGENPGINQRAAVADSRDADLFLSLHLNAAANTAARGFQVFPVLPGREHHVESMRAAEIMARTVAAETGLPMMGTSGIYYAIYRGAQYKDFYDASQYDAASVADGPSFGVLEHSDTPALLVEQWFITSPEDMAAMNSAEGYDTMAKALYHSICEYFGIQPKL